MNNPSPSIFRTILVLLLLAGAFAAGMFLTRSHSHDNAATAPNGEKQLWTCGMHPQVIQDTPGDCPICHMELTPLKGGASAANGAHDSSVTINPVIVQNMGIRVTEVISAPLHQTVRLVGYIQEPEPLQYDISPRFGGWIDTLHADTEGVYVEKGQPLFSFYSPEVNVAIEELIAARKQTGQSAQVLQSAARRKLELWGLTPAQVDELAKLDQAPKAVNFLAPITGHVTEKMVYAGGAFDAGMRLMRISNRKHMWLDAQAFERQLPLIQIGAKALATVESQPGRIYEAKVVFFHPHLDPVTRTALVRVELNNDDMALRQGMFATVRISSEPSEPTLLIPREAIIDTGTRQIVFISEGNGRFSPRNVRVGFTGDGGLVQILEGLKAGEMVVTSGQFLLDSESRLKEVLQKHLTDQLVVKPKEPAGEAVAVAHADEIVAEYLKISQALGAPQQSAEPIDVEPLVKLARQSAEHTQGEGKSLAADVTSAAEAMAGQPIDPQRELFVKLSAAVITLAERTKISSQVAPALYVVRCPMAFGTTADWLQATPEIANPFYATRMKSCGTIERTIETRTAE